MKRDIKRQYDKDSLGIKGENKKYLLQFYRERYTAITDMFTEGEVVGLAQANTYLNQLTQAILNSNPQLQLPPTRFLFNRAYWPNAASFGEGTIIFNIGLFTKLQNEAQVVFVLCHELAHLHFDHSNNAIRQYVNTVYSDEFQRKLKEINKLEYEKNREADKLIKPLVFSSRRHGREHESQADSLALVLMMKTGFSSQEAINCLQLLDTIDEDNFNTEKKLPEVFNFADYPFKPRWLHKEEAFFGVSDANQLTDKEADSLKTNPDCKQRALHLNPIIAAQPQQGAKKFLGDVSAFQQMQEWLQYEAIEHCYKSERISRCLYLALSLYDTRKKDAYLIATIGKCLVQLYDHQKAHTLNHVAELPSLQREKNYNRLLEFIQKISLSDIAGISYHFMQLHEKELASHEDFVYALIKSKAYFEKPDEKKQWQDYYHKTFNHPKYKF